MSESITIIIRIPPIELTQNARVHWDKRRKLTRQVRYEGNIITIGEMIKNNMVPHEPWCKAELQATFYWASLRRRDSGNAMSRLKATIDGIVDAGLIKDDRYEVLREMPPLFMYDKKNPRVQITIKKGWSDV